MARSTRVIGRIIKCTVKEISNGQTAAFMRETTSMIKSTGLDESNGLTVGSMRESGKMAFNMAKGSIRAVMEFGRKEGGNAEKG